MEGGKKLAIQIIILGDGAVGKTSMINQTIHQKFNDDHITTLGLDFASKVYTTKVDGKDISVKVWDTAGQERFKTLTHAFYKNADGIIISYDVTTRSSFESIKSWVDSIETHGKKNAARIMVGNKIDLDRQVPKEDG